MRIPLTACFVTLLAGTPAPLAAQAGAAVATADGDVLVVSPSAGRGPAAVLVYRRAGDTWRIVQRLGTQGTSEKGHAFAASIAVAGEQVLVGSGDPDGRWGAHAFQLDASATWRQVVGIPLTASDEQDAAPTTVSLATVMRILQPPRRVIAAHGGRAIASVLSGPADLTGVRVYDRVAGQWADRGRLVPAEERQGFGAAVAIRGDVAVVTSRARRGGAAHVFERGAGGEWTETAVIPSDSTLADAAFGSSVVLGDGVLVVGAPAGGGGTVVVYGREGGMWSEHVRLAGDSAGAQFGAALAIDGDRLIVGAPGADDRRGAVYRFTRDGGAWRGAGRLPAPDLEPRTALGTALAASGGLVVAGAPGAGGFQGGAAVWRGANPTAPTWIVAGSDLVTVTGGEQRCTDGAAAGFACGNVDLAAFLTVEALGGGPGESVTDIWGWADPETGREYALVGRTGGLVFVDITEPTRPAVLGMLASNRAGLRDVKVYAHHAFVVGDGAGNHGLVVFDLTRLRGAAGPSATFEPDAKYDGIASAHNLVIDTAAGFAYPVGVSGGGNTCGGGLHMVDIRSPKQPTFAGCYTDTEGLLFAGRTHDAQCVVYSGPDTEHQGKQICFASNETAVRIVDVTDKAHPVPLAAAKYPGMAYVHQGWLTDDQRYFYLDDELDELVGTTDRTRTMIWDVEDLDDPVLVGIYRGTTGATDHNLYIKGDRMYQANYQAGFRLIDISDRARPVEVGYFDTTPYEGNPAGFSGAWTAYPFFRSGVVIVSSMGEGLFVLKPRVSPLVP